VWVLNACSSTEESGVVCLKVECAVNDIACMLNVTKSIQWQHVSLPSVDAVTSPLDIVDVRTARPTDRPSIADLYPTSFHIVAGNDDQLFDVVDRTPQDPEDSSRPPSDTSAAGGIQGKVVGRYHMSLLTSLCTRDAHSMLSRGEGNGPECKTGK